MATVDLGRVRAKRFIAVYEETTYAEITEALEDNEDIEATKSGISYRYLGYSDTAYVFATISTVTTNSLIFCDVNTGWSETSATLATIQLVQSLVSPKADETSVASRLATKANAADVETELAKKADIDDVDAEIGAINAKIPTQATAQNQLADRSFVNSSINSVTAYYITKNAQGDQFASKAELDSATVFYSGGEVRVPTRNDYCIVQVDEEKDDATTRYIYQNKDWEYQYTVNETALTSDQIKALNSGITAELVADMASASEVAEALEEKADELTTQQALATKLTEPSNLAVGKFFRIKEIDENGHAVLETADAGSGLQLLYDETLEESANVITANIEASQEVYIDFLYFYDEGSGTIQGQVNGLRMMDVNGDAAGSGKHTLAIISVFPSGFTFSRVRYASGGPYDALYDIGTDKITTVEFAKAQTANIGAGSRLRIWKAR